MVRMEGKRLHDLSARPHFETTLIDLVLDNFLTPQASEMAKRYEAKGGDYEDSGDNANEAKKGAPQPKKEAVAKGERKDPSEKVGTPKKPASDSKRKADTKSEDADKSKKPKKAKAPPKPATKGTREQPKRGVKK